MLAKLVEAVNKRIDEVRSKLSKETYVLLISGISSIILGVEGYLSVLSGLLCLSSSFLQYMSSDADSFATQFVLSLYFSEACGALMSAPLSDNFGRRSTIAYSSVACILSLLWTMLSRNAADLLTSRTMCGFALGIITSTVPVYIAELALPADRGLLLGTLPVASATGSLLACVSCLLVADVAVWWREFLVPPLLALLALLGGLLVVAPESPRWLLARKTPAECLEALKRLRRGGMVDVNSEFSGVYIALSRDARLGDGWTDLAHSRSIFFRLLLACSLQLAMQGVGMQVVASSVYGVLGESALKVASAVAYAAALAGAIFGCRHIDSFGRRKMLFAGCLGMVLAIAGIALCRHSESIAMVPPSSVPEHIVYLKRFLQKLFLTACLCLFTASHAFGIGQLAWTIAAEIFPLRARGKANALSTAFHAWAYIIVSRLGGPADAGTTRSSDVTPSTLAVFAVAIASIAAVAFVFLPETTDVMLEEMEELFDLDSVTCCCCTADKRVLGLRHRPARAATTARSLNQCAGSTSTYSYQASLARPFEPETLHKYSTGMRGVNFQFYGAADDIFPRAAPIANLTTSTGRATASQPATAASSLLLPSDAL